MMNTTMISGGKKYITWCLITLICGCTSNTTPPLTETESVPESITEVEQTVFQKIPDDCQQVVLVSSKSWSSTTGQMFLLEKSNSQWDTVGTAIINLGKSGMAWGRGLHKNTGLPEKKEGDDCAPAGVFEFDFAFGYAEKPTGVDWEYKQSTNRDYFVDDAKSKDYNTWRSIPASETNNPKLQWDSCERMKRKDYLYELGLVVKHNYGSPVAGKGSAIFFHVERAVGSPTLGCTSMKISDLQNLLQWLDPNKHPLLIQTPQKELSNLVFLR